MSNMAKKQPQRPKPVPVPQPTPQAKVSVPKESAKQTPAGKYSLNLKLALFLGVITLIIYANTLQNGFVLDDSMVYSKNSIVTQGFQGIPELLKTPRLKGF